MKGFTLFVFVLSTLSSCAIRPINNVPKEAKAQRPKITPKKKVVQRKRKIRKPRVVRREKKGLNLSYSQSHYKFWIKYFTKRERARFQRHLRNAVQVEKVVKAIFRKNGLPEDLFYVGLIESGYNSRIRSRAGATGPWQFVSGTARSYGMRMSGGVDERSNIFKATEAAAHYFKDLYNIFGSWELALCAYNKGEYGIIRAIRKGNTRNYQELIRKGLIPKETVYYIPKVAAARHLMKNLKLYGFKKDNAELSMPVALHIKRPFSIKEISRKIGISRQELLRYNQDLRWNKIKPTRAGHKVYFPIRYRERLSGLYNPLGPKQVKKLNAMRDWNPARKERSEEYIRYRVKRGENLSSIARKFGTTWPVLKRVNKLKRDIVFVGQRLKVPNNGNKVFYTVKSGDNLTLIARRFRTSVTELRRINRLKSSTVFPRQKLLVSL